MDLTALTRIIDRDPAWTLDELSERANALLPAVLAAAGGPADSGRLRDDVNPRLIRHYVTAGLVDAAAREGREARYGARHLAQLLCTRRLLHEGHPAAMVRRAIAGLPNGALLALLRGGGLPAAVAPGAIASPPASRAASRVPSNPALDFVQAIRRRESSVALPPPPPLPSAVSQWRRAEVEPGLESTGGRTFPTPATAPPPSGSPTRSSAPSNPDSRVPIPPLP